MRLFSFFKSAFAATPILEIESGGCMAHYPREVRRGVEVGRARNSGRELPHHPKGEPCILIRYESGEERWAPLAPYHHFTADDVGPGFRHLADPSALTRFF